MKNNKVNRSKVAPEKKHLGKKTVWISEALQKVLKKKAFESQEEETIETIGSLIEKAVMEYYKLNQDGTTKVPHTY